MPNPHQPASTTNRLRQEQRRLYLPAACADADADAGQPSLVDAEQRVRALVLELARPAEWAAVSRVWKGVQLDLELPAPAIAVSGRDGYQLWFSLAAAVPAAQALVFLEALCRHYLNDIKPSRVTLWPSTESDAAPVAWRAKPLPPLQATGERWSAFVAADLAPMFADEPWLDMPPNPDGQSNLLSGLESMQLEGFQAVLDRLGPAATSLPVEPAASEARHEAVAPSPMQSGAAQAGAPGTPQRFLLDVMNDPSVALALRIEAAKALLPGFEPRR